MKHKKMEIYAHKRFKKERNLPLGSKRNDLVCGCKETNVEKRFIDRNTFNEENK